MFRALLAVILFTSVPVFASGIIIDVEGEANGSITIDLFEDIAPDHTSRVLKLAEEGQYNGVVFHRVIEGFMAQTGDVQFGKVLENRRRVGTVSYTHLTLPTKA